MKNKELALKISKHPLMEKVAKLEDKRVVARLVIEELLRESNDLKNKMNQSGYKFIVLEDVIEQKQIKYDIANNTITIIDKESQKDLVLLNYQVFIEKLDKFEQEKQSKVKTKKDSFYFVQLTRMDDVVIPNEENQEAQNSTFIARPMTDEEYNEETDGEETEVTATPEQQQQVQKLVIKVEDSLKDFFKYLKNKITGGAEVPEEETIEEGLFDNIKKGLERSPGKAKDTFFKLLSKYLKDANVGIDLSPEDIQRNWNEWIQQGGDKKTKEASDIIAAYTYHFNIFGNKPELTGKLIQDAAEEIVVGGKSKLDKFIEEIVNIAYEEFALGLKNKAEALGEFKNTNFDEGVQYNYDTFIRSALDKKLNDNQDAINELMNNKKFTDPAEEKLKERLKELQAEMLFEPEDGVFRQIADNLKIEKDGYSLNGIKNSLDGFTDNEFYNDEQIKKHVDYLLEEGKGKRIVDFIYKYITYPNTREDFKSLKPALKKLAVFLKKTDGYGLKTKELNESLLNLSDRFDGDFELLLKNLVDSGIEYSSKVYDQLNKFFKFQNNLEYFVEYFFGDDELKEPEEEKEENYTYSYLVLIALNNQTKKREAELKSYFSALKKRVDKLTKDNEKPQAQKYTNLKNESVFLISKLKTYNSIIKSYMDYKKDRESGSDITDNILVEFGNEFPDSDEVFKLIRWTDKSENLIQYEDKTIPASEVYLKDIEKWEELSGPEKAKAFLYDYRTLIRDKEDGEIKRFIDRVNRIDDQIRSGKEPAPRDEKADDAIPKERYEYFLQETKPIAKFLQETPITFGDSQINFGKEIQLPEFNNDQGSLKDLVIQLNRNEFNKTKLFKYIGSPQDPEKAKERILKTIETLKAFQQAKKDGLANDEVAYDAFIGEVKDNLTYFKMGWPLFQSTGRGLKLNTPYADNKKIEKMFLIEELTDELVRMANMGGKQVRAAIKSKYSGKDEEQKGLIEKLNELTKERNFEIARDCANVYKEQGMSGPSYNEATVPRDRSFPQNRLKKESWNKIKKLIDDIIKPFYSNHIDAALPDIENKDRYKKFLEAYKEIVQIAKDDGQELDVIDNKKPQDQRKFEFQEQLTKLIKPLIREKLKRKQNGKKNLRN